jgi:hypothetical protein
MPIVRVEMFPGRTHAQKQELARAITEAVANIDTTPDATIVVRGSSARIGAGRQAASTKTMVLPMGQRPPRADTQTAVRALIAARARSRECAGWRSRGNPDVKAHESVTFGLSYMPRVLCYTDRKHPRTPYTGGKG